MRVSARAGKPANTRAVAVEETEGERFSSKDEDNIDRGVDLDRLAVQGCGGVTPLANGIESRLNEERMA